MIRARAPLSCLCFSIGLLLTLSALSFPVHAGSSDLTVDSIWLERASAPHVPVAGTDLSPNESFNIVASIKNLGQETASGYYLDVYYDSDYGRGGPDNIASGEAQEWYVGPLTATVGTHVTQWVVDPDNQIAELNEQNNVSQYVFTVGSGETQTANGTTVTATVTQTATSLAYETTTTTVTSYSLSTLTSTVPTLTTVVLVPSTVSSVVQSVQYLTSTLTTTVTSYTRTETSTSTIVVPATVTLVPSAATLTAQTTQVLTSTGTTTVTGYTTTTQTSYTDTKTSTSTNMVYTTVTKLASAGASSPLTYLGFISLLAVTVGQRVTASRGRRIPKMQSRIEGRCSRS